MDKNASNIQTPQKLSYNVSKDHQLNKHRFFFVIFDWTEFEKNNVRCASERTSEQCIPDSFSCAFEDETILCLHAIPILCRLLLAYLSSLRMDRAEWRRYQLPTIVFHVLEMFFSRTSNFCMSCEKTQRTTCQPFPYIVFESFSWLNGKNLNGGCDCLSFVRWNLTSTSQFLSVDIIASFFVKFRG